MRETMELETLAIHAGHSLDPATRMVAVPIYQTMSYAFDSTQHSADLADIYSLIMNPTNDLFELRITAIESRAGGLVGASGMTGSFADPHSA